MYYFYSGKYAPIGFNQSISMIDRNDNRIDVFVRSQSGNVESVTIG